MASQTDIRQKHILGVFRKHFLYSKILLQRGHIVLQQIASLNLEAFRNIATLPHCHIATLPFTLLSNWKEVARATTESRREKICISKSTPSRSQKSLFQQQSETGHVEETVWTCYWSLGEA